MVNFTHYLPTKFVFGRGVENQVGEEVKKLGATKVLIHYGGGSAVRSPEWKIPWMRRESRMSRSAERCPIRVIPRSMRALS